MSALGQRGIKMRGNGIETTVFITLATHLQLKLEAKDAGHLGAVIDRWARERRIQNYSKKLKPQ